MWPCADLHAAAASTAALLLLGLNGSFAPPSSSPCKDDSRCYRRSSTQFDSKPSKLPPPLLTPPLPSVSASATSCKTGGQHTYTQRCKQLRPFNTAR